jgi:hypothetical protein
VSDASDSLTADGACVVRRVVSAADVAAVAAEFLADFRAEAGVRGVDRQSRAGRLIASDGALGRLANALSGRPMRPVRVVRFDKTAATNWMVPWHQDRTIAVARRIDVEGFGPWTVKDGVAHVEPPVALLAEMLTLRLFVDACGPRQGPVKVALGSHRLGRVSAAEAAAKARAAPVLTATGEAGDVLAMRLLALHASARSASDAPRRVLHVDYAWADLPPPLTWAAC